MTVENIPTGNVSTFFALEHSQLLDRLNILQFRLFGVFREQEDEHSIRRPTTHHQSENNQTQANFRQGALVPHSTQALTPLSADVTLQGHALSFLSKVFRSVTTACNYHFPDDATRPEAGRISALAAVSSDAEHQYPSQKVKVTAASPLKKCQSVSPQQGGWDKWYSFSGMTDQLEFTKD